MDRLDVVSEVSTERRGDLVELFASTWWAAERTADDVAAIVEGSDLVVGVIDAEANRLVGFCRVLTDRRFLAVILDVIVHPDWQGRGLGALILDEVLARPELAGVESIELVCQPDLIDFYRRWGFTDAIGDSRLMRRSTNPRLVR